MMNVAVVGSRNLNNYSKFKDELELLLTHEMINVDKFISGGARGIDTLTEEYALSKFTQMEIYKADWDKYKPDDPNRKNPAGMIRNTEIVNNSDIIIAFWDYKSKGTKNTIFQAMKNNKTVYIIDMENESKINVLNRKLSLYNKADSYIGRGSVFGNPFKLSEAVSRTQSVYKYYNMVKRNDELKNNIKELNKKFNNNEMLNLLCYCSPKLCHGHILKYFIINYKEGFKVL